MSKAVSGSALSFRILATTSLVALASGASAVTLHDLPKGARPGECFAHKVTPAVYRTDHIPVPQPPLVSWREVPAVYNTVTRQVVVSPARVDHENIPAVMGTRMHWDEQAGPDRVVTTPPVYRWVEQRVMVSPPHLEWRRGGETGGYGGGDTGYGAPVSVRPTGEVMCRVRVPGRYEIRRVRVLVSPGRSCVVKGPSTRVRVVEHFVVTPAHVVDHPVAAVYRTVTDRVMVRGPRKERVETPQPPRYLDKRVLVTPAQTGWTRIDCAPPTVRRAGYTPRPQPQPSYGAPQPYQPDYAQPRPGELDGAPQPAPGYHAPDAGQSYGGPSR